MIEIFLVESCIEHLRQHERVTNADRLIQEAVDRFDLAGAPKVTHLIAADSWRENHCGTLSIDRAGKVRHYRRGQVGRER
jgi:hypothetical protein